MSKNTELLSGFLMCMIKMTDKLHATNNKLIDCNEKINDLSGLLTNISGNVGNTVISGDIERFIDENELEERLDQLEVKDIDVDDDLIAQIENLQNGIGIDHSLSGINPNLKDELIVMNNKINNLYHIISGGIVDPNIERFIDENELEERLDQLSIADIDINDESLLSSINDLNNNIN